MKSIVLPGHAPLVTRVYRLMKSSIRVSRKALACGFFRRYARASAPRLMEALVKIYNAHHIAEELKGN